MRHVMSGVGARVAGFPRPLLFTVGAAATAVGVHWFWQRSAGGNRAASLEDATPEPALLRTAQLFQVSQAEAEKKGQKAVEPSDQLEAEKHDITDQVKILQRTLQDVWITFCEIQRENNELQNECKQLREAHGIVQVENNEMKETLKTETEEKHQKALETTEQLEAEKSDLTDQVKKSQESPQDMRTPFCQIQRECDELKKECEREREAHSILKFKYDEIQKALMHNEETLKAEAEEKHQKALETIEQLEAEKSDLTDQVKILRGTLQDMGKQLCETQRECDELQNECEREREANSILKFKNLMHNEETLKAEAEEKHQKALETIEQLEAEKSDLTDQVKILQGTVQGTANQLSETQSECDELQNAEAEEKHQKALETIEQLEAEKSDLTDQVKILRRTVQDMANQLSETQRECDELQNVCVQEREAYSILQIKHNEMKNKLMHKELLETEIKGKYKEALETVKQLEAEICDLTDQVDTLQETVLDMGNQLAETHIECDKLQNRCEQEREAHTILKLEYNEMKKTLTDSEELLKGSLAETEEKYQKAVESSAKLEAEICQLKNQMETVQDTVHDIKDMRIVTHSESD